MSACQLCRGYQTHSIKSARQRPYTMKARQHSVETPMICVYSIFILARVTTIRLSERCPMGRMSECGPPTRRPFGKCEPRALHFVRKCMCLQIYSHAHAQTHKRTQKCTEILFYLMKTIKNNRGKHALDLSPFRPGTATFLNAGLKPTSNFFLALCGLVGWRILGFDTLARCVSNTAGPRVWWKMSRMRVTENAGALRAGWVCQLEKKLYTMHVNDE